MSFQKYAILFLLCINCFLCKAFDVGLLNEQFKSEKFDFNIKKFVDARMNRTKFVGFTNMGTFKGIEEILLPRDLGKYCDSFFIASPVKFKYKQSFCAIINQVSIQEVYEDSQEYSDVTLSIDYYLIDTITQKCSLYYRSYYKSILGSATDVTKKHAKNLSHAFLVSFQNLNDHIVSKQTLFNSVPLKMDLLIDSLSKKQTPPKDTLITNGFFYSTKQLYQNLPKELSPKFLAFIDTSRLEYYLNEDVASLMGPTCYAFAKQGVLYICVKKNLYHKAEVSVYKKNAYIIDAYGKKSTIQPTRNRNHKSYYMFGLIGVIAQEIIETTQSRKDGLYVDLENGLIGKY